jgi:uncharacterized protein (TIGR02646 family)
MIRLKAKPATPASLQSNTVTRLRQRLSTKVRARQTLSAKDFPSQYWLADDVRLTLWDHHDGKCCYCERKRDPKREPDIEHFRPKGAVTGVRGRNSGYWWLAYDWTNLFFACKSCNQQYKKNHFPVLGKRARRPSSSIAAEEPVLIDPIQDKPEELIDYVWDFGKVPLAKAVGKDDEHRGQNAIEILGLSRTFLNEERGRLLLALRGIAAKMHAALQFDKPRLVTRTEKEIVEATSRSNDFAGFRRAFFRAQGLGDYVAKD